MTPRTPRLPLARILVVLGAMLAIFAACSSDGTSLQESSGTAPSPAPVATGGSSGGGSGGGGTSSGPCADGTWRKCGVIQGEHDGEVWCLEGEQQCQGGQWGACGAEGPRSTMLKAVSPQRFKPQDLGAPTDVCADNPCDPNCWDFPDTPGGTTPCAAGLTCSTTGITLASSATPATFTRQFDATCPAGMAPRWSELQYTTTEPNAGTTVVFNVKTAATSAGLSTASNQGAPFPVTAGSASPSCSYSGTPSCFVDLTKLVPNVDPWLEMDATLTGSGGASPTLVSWDVNYDCVVSTGLIALTVTPASQSIYVGHGQQLTATGTFADGTTANVTTTVNWTSSNGGVANIATGACSAGSVGCAQGVAAGGPITITATDPSTNLSATATLTVLANGIKSISVTPISATVTTTNPNKNVQYTAIATYDDGTTGDVTSSAAWASSTTQIATIAAVGQATANSTVWTTSSSYVQPPVATTCTGTTVTVSFLSSGTPMSVGEQLFISGVGYSGGNYQICSVGVNSATLINLGGVNNASPGTNIPTGTSANLVGSTIITATDGGVTSNNATLLVTAAVLSSISVGVASNVTTTAAAFTQPASSSTCTLNTVTVSVPSPGGTPFTGLPSGAPLQIGGNAYTLCSATATTLTVINPGLNGSAAPGASIPVTSVVSLLAPDCVASGATFTCNGITFSPAVSCPLGRVQHVYGIGTFADGTCGDISTNGAYTWTTSNAPVGTLNATSVTTSCAPVSPYPAGLNDTVGPENVGPPSSGATTGSATLTLTEPLSGINGAAADTVTAAVVDTTGASTCSPATLTSASLSPSAASIEYVSSFTASQVIYGSAAFTPPAVLTHSVYSAGGQTYSNCSTVAGASTTGTGGTGTWTSSSTVATIPSVGTTAVAGNWTSPTTTTGFTQPASGSTVSVTVGSTTGMSAGQPVYVNTGGFYTVSSVTSGTVVVLTNTGAAGNAAAAASIAPGSAVLLAPTTAFTNGTSTITYSYTDTNAGNAACGNTAVTATATATVKKPYAKGVTAGVYGGGVWLSDGGWEAWGIDGNYQMGQPPGVGAACKGKPTNTCINTPMAVAGLGVSQAGGWQNPRAVNIDMSMGYNSFIVLVDGTVRGLGYNGFGDLGDDANPQTDQPVPVATAAGTTTTAAYTQVASGSNVTVTVGSTTGMVAGQYVYIDSGTQDITTTGASGSYYTVSSVTNATTVVLTNNTAGLGTHNRASGASFPSGSVVVPQNIWLTGATQVSGQYDGACAVLTSGGIDCWGRNPYGELGASTTATCGSGASAAACSKYALPVQLSGGGALTGAVKVVGYGFATSANFFCALAGTSVYCWGQCGALSGSSGQCGSGNTAAGAATTNNVKALTGLTGTPVDVAVGVMSACARTSTPAVQCWGETYGGSTGNTTTPDSVKGATTPVTVTSNGTLALGGMSGAAGMGLLSMGGPAQSIHSAGSYYYGTDGLVVLTSGGLDGWGTNNNAAITGLSGDTIGNNATVDEGYAVSTLSLSTGTALTGVVWMDTGYAATCAVTSAAATNGQTQSLYCWGDNTNADLGDGTGTAQNEAEQIAY